MRNTDKLRYKLPYGVYFMANTDLVLFNRAYQPIMHWSAASECMRDCSPDWWVPNICRQEWFHNGNYSPSQHKQHLSEVLELWESGNPVTPSELGCASPSSRDMPEGEWKESLTVLTASSPRGQKISDKGYVKGWDSSGLIPPKFPFFNLYETLHPVDIHELSKILTDLEGDTHSCVIRGVVKEGVANPCRRRAISFNDKLHWFVCLDFDSIPGELAPHEVVKQCLPEEFQNASFHWQYSGSHGFKEGTRMHAWFWMDKPVTSSGWIEWMASHGTDTDGKPLLQIDPALYRVVQPHITANPILKGVSDPVEIRSGFFQGKVDSVPFRVGKRSVAAGSKAVSAGNVAPLSLEGWKEKQTGVIGEFNLRFEVGEVLEWFGYQRVGNRYLHPFSQSLIPDTVINSGTHAYVFSPENQLYEQGVDRTTGEILNRNHDAFDCFKILGCEGNEVQAAARAAALLESTND